MNEASSGPAAPPRRPWERPPEAPLDRNPERPAPPWTAPAPDDGPAMTVTPGLEDEVAATGLVVEATSPRGGLGTALLGGLAMLTAVTVVLASADSRWKSPFPSGLSLAVILLLVAVFAGLGWLIGARLLPRVRRAATTAHARRLLRAERAAERGTAREDAPARIVLGERALHRTDARTARRFDTALLRGMVESQDLLVLRFGLVSIVVLPRRDLTPEQEAALRGWVARHAREGVA